MRSRTTVPFDPTVHFQLLDIALWTTSLRRDGEYQYSVHDGKCNVQTMRSSSAEILSVSFDDKENVDVLRALINLGVRSVFHDPDAQEEVALYTLEATFAVEYAITKMPSDEDLEEFVSFNCTHNAWPFWRQHVYDTLKRASLPVPLIPFFSGKPKAGRKLSKSRQQAIEG